MKQSLSTYKRPSGIEVMNDVPWGAHYCNFYETKEDLLDTLAPYFKAGLENNEFCLWEVSDPITVNNAIQALRSAVPHFDRYLDKQSIEILPHEEWYLRDGVFDAKRVTEGWIQKLDQALSRGFTGMRVNGNESWLNGKNWEDFMDYEHEINKSLAGLHIIALCTYSLARSSAADILDVARAHNGAISKRRGRWEFVEVLSTRTRNDRPKESKDSRLALPTFKGFTLVKVSEILYCKAAGNYTEVFTTEAKKYLVSRPLGEYEKILNEYDFFRIHHSFIINLNCIQNYVRGEGGYVVMDDNTELRVARRKKDAFLERIRWMS